MCVREDDRAFIAKTYSYMFVGLMLDWVADDMRGDPAEIVRRLALCIEGTVAAALARFRTDSLTNSAV